MALSCPQPDELPVTLPNIMGEIINAGGRLNDCELLQQREYILQAQGMNFIPSSIDLSGIENILINTMSRENVLKKLLNFIKDCAGSC